MSDDDRLATARDSFDGPLPNRFTRGTMVGCLGLLCLLAMLVLLALPLERWSTPLWIGTLVPLAAFALAALGTWLVVRVPASTPERSHDPTRPLTGAGLPPMLERPAQRENRMAAGAAAVLLLTGGSGYILASASGMVLATLWRGIALGGLAGILLVVNGILVAGGWLPVPALRWVRVSVQSSVSRQGAPIVLIGLVWVLWALWVAFAAGMRVGAAGLAVLTLLAVVAAPLARSGPARRGAAHELSTDTRRLHITDRDEQGR
jgi:hypothetical protein